MYRKVILTTPALSLFGMSFTKDTACGGGDSKGNDERAHYKCKPSELPLYTPLHAQDKPAPPESSPQKESYLRELVGPGVHAARVGVQNSFGVVTDKMKVFDNYIDTAKAHTQATVDYLNEPQNTIPRIGAVAVGGLAGFVLAIRRGIIKKILYTTIGAAAMATVCYPTVMEQFAQDALKEARKTFHISYNFAKGVKPGEVAPMVDDAVKKFPTSLEDVKFLWWDIYDEAKETMFPSKPKKEE